MSRAFGLGCTIVAVGLLAAPAARAEVSPDQAKALQQQLQGWVAGVIGPAVKLPPLPIHITPDGDHYRIEIPLPDVIGDSLMTVKGDSITAEATPLDGGRWSIDDVKLPSPLQLNVISGPPDMHNTYTLKLDEQKNHSVFDPTLATSSAFDGQARGLTQTMDGKLGPRTTTIARMSWHQTWQPAQDGRMTLLGETTMQGYASSQPAKTKPDVTVAIDSIHATWRDSQADFAELGKAVRIALSLAATMPKDSIRHLPTARPDATPAQRDMARRLVISLANLFSGMEGQETLQGVHFHAADHDGNIASVMIGGGFAAPNGRADLHMRLAIDGIESSDIPPGVYRDYLPRHIVIAPRVSGIPKADLMRVLLQAVDTQGKPGSDSAELTAAAIGLLAKGPLSLGLDDLEFDLGPAKVDGHGKVTMTSPTDISGEADLRATGLDELLHRATTTPELKQAMPVLIFLKGLGKPQGDATLWKITYQSHKMMVNGTDLSGMVPQAH